MIKIYTLTCPITNIVKYIGKTKQKINIRLQQHINTSKRRNAILNTWLKSLTSKNLTPIIEEIDITDDNEMANILEKMYIGLFKSWGFILKNSTIGGDGNCFMSIDTRRKISESHKKLNNDGINNNFYGKKHTEETKIKMRIKRRNNFGKQCSDIMIDLIKTGKYKVRTGGDSNNAKKVGMYDKQFNLIKTYDCITDAEKDGFCRRNIHDCLKQGTSKTHHGYVWKYL